MMNRLGGFFITQQCPFGPVPGGQGRSTFPCAVLTDAANKRELQPDSLPVVDGGSVLLRVVERATVLAVSRDSVPGALA